MVQGEVPAIAQTKSDAHPKEKNRGTGREHEQSGESLHALLNGGEDCGSPATAHQGHVETSKPFLELLRLRPPRTCGLLGDCLHVTTVVARPSASLLWR